MEGRALVLTTLGALLLVALCADWAGRHTPLPRVSVLLVLGVLAGPAGLDVLPEAREQWEPVVTDLALAMVGFLLGGAALELQPLVEQAGLIAAYCVLRTVGKVAGTPAGAAAAGVRTAQFALACSAADDRPGEAIWQKRLQDARGMSIIPPPDRRREQPVAETSAEVDLVLMLVVLGLAALVVLALQVARALQPARPSLPDEDRPPPGLGRLVPVGRQVDQECRSGLDALELWLASRRVRP